MNTLRADCGSPALVPMILEAWSKGLTGEAVVVFVCKETGCKITEVLDALDHLYGTMKD